MPARTIAALYPGLHRRWPGLDRMTSTPSAGERQADDTQGQQAQRAGFGHARWDAERLSDQVALICKAKRRESLWQRYWRKERFRAIRSEDE